MCGWSFILGLNCDYIRCFYALFSFSGRLSALQHPDSSEATVASLLLPVGSPVPPVLPWFVCNVSSPTSEPVVRSRHFKCGAPTYLCVQPVEGRFHWEKSRHAAHQDVHEGVAKLQRAGLVPDDKVAAWERETERLAAITHICEYCTEFASIFCACAPVRTCPKQRGARWRKATRRWWFVRTSWESSSCPLPL